MRVVDFVINAMRSPASHLFILCCFAIPYSGLAQSPPPASDSLLSYDLDEIVVSTGEVFEPEPNTVHRVSIAEIERRNARAVSDLARLIPAVHVQTNSRGESLIYVRNAGERQVALFFKGALLNIPWDNRINLDLVPANVVGGITVAKGVPSVLYGTNVLGGAINMTSRSVDNEGSLTEIGGGIGAHEMSNLNLVHLRSTGNWKIGIAAGYNTRDGFPVPDESELPFSQQDADVRTNTDREFLNLYGEVEHRFDSGTQVSLSYLLIDGEYGIAPESHVDPSESSVRFWRFPQWQNQVLILSGAIPTKDASLIRGALWGNWFQQDIQSFTTATYDNLEETQQDTDNTVGSRFTWEHALGAGSVNIALNGLMSEHEEAVTEFSTDGVETAGVPETYRQWLYSLGVEYGVPISKVYKLNVGGSVDGFSTPETGDKPSLDPFLDYGFNVGVQRLFGDDWIARMAVGRKVRFPTMRELFGVALNRFLLNPDLSPESSFVTELALSKRGTAISGELVGFYQRTFDTIDQRRVNVDGVSLRQRVTWKAAASGGSKEALLLV